MKMCRRAWPINKAIQAGSTFAADDSHKFVNGVLDKVIKTLNKR